LSLGFGFRFWVWFHVYGFESCNEAFTLIQVYCPFVTWPIPAIGFS